MSDQKSSSDVRSQEEIDRVRGLAELVIGNRRESLETLGSFRDQARSLGLSALEELLLLAQQSDQRVLEGAERFAESLKTDGEAETTQRDHLVDEEVAESFPASDPPTYSRIT